MKTVKTNKFILITISTLALVFTAAVPAVEAETNPAPKPVLSTLTKGHSIQLVSGIAQPIVNHGANIEINYITENWVFEYSHGMFLNLAANPDLTQTPTENKQGLTIKAPYSTGGGVGYRITEGFNLRLETKVHQFDVKRKKTGESFSYTNVDVGLGLYYFWQPFDAVNLVVVPSVRFWPMVANSLDGGEYKFNDGKVHEPHEFGLFANISVGYRFDL